MRRASSKAVEFTSCPEEQSTDSAGECRRTWESPALTEMEYEHTANGSVPIPDGDGLS